MMDDAIEPSCPARALQKHGFIEALSEYSPLAMRRIAAKSTRHNTKANA